MTTPDNTAPDHESELDFEALHHSDEPGLVVHPAMFNIPFETPDNESGK